MRLVADRFAVDDDGRAVDLATGGHVTLTIANAGDPMEQREWQIRSDERFRLRDRTQAVLVDYGLLGVAQRFEAWQGLPRLRAELPASSFAIELIDRPAVAELSAMCADAAESRPRLVVLRGPRGAGKTTSVLCLARSARMAGFVPIAVSVIDRLGALVHDRTWFLIEQRVAPAPWFAWLAATVRNPRAHICIVVSVEEIAGIDSIALDRLTPAALLSALRPATSADRLPARIRHAAERSRGLPGPFVHCLWPPPTIYRRSRPWLSRVAEQAAVYGGDTNTDPVQPFVSWSDPGALATFRQQTETATRLIEAGRHAPGARMLREAVGGLARRQAWSDAGRSASVLSSSLLRRGRVKEAQRVLEQAADYARRAADERLVIEAAALAGEAWIDRARLDEAERVLSAAVGSARARGDQTCVAAASVGLARCLFWRGRYADAWSLLDDDREPTRVDHRDQPVQTIDVRRLRWRAAAAIALGDTSRAMAAVDEARGRVADEGAALADVEWTAAFVHLVAGDVDGAERHAANSVALAHGARRPMRRISARLLQMEIARRRGRSTAAFVESLRRVVPALPPIVKARWDLVSALPSGSAVQMDLVERHVAATGLAALAVFVASVSRAGAAGADPFVEELVDILRICQTADDEVTVLEEVCVRVREHLRAAAVVFASADHKRIDVVASDGGRGTVDCSFAERVVASGITIVPQRHAERIESGAAIQYGGSIIGAVCARWTVGTTPNLARGPAVLAVAAAAAAPLLSALQARRQRRMPLSASDLLGVAPAIADLRQAIERAAAAPFAVLIEGESGVGKELVARAIHRSGLRRNRPFCTLNCAALPDDLVEAELFGHARGSFTGAIADRAGVFEEANGGTVFLDEVGELSPRAQAKVLRVVQEGELRRIGENVPRRIDVRIVSATNRDLRREVEAGRFRLDLLYRLDVIRITVPPLRDRKEDLAVLADHFWQDATHRMGSRATLGSATRAALAGYDWPGNVRELQNVLAALAARTPKRGVVPPTALPVHVAGARRQEVWRLDAARKTFDEGFIRAALVRAGGCRSRAADELGVSRQGLTKLMTRLGITSFAE